MASSSESRSSVMLTRIREEDVSRTMYRETLRADERLDSNITAAQPGKVNRICIAFLEALSGRKANVKNMITAQVCKNPPDLDSGLLEIVRLRGECITIAPRVHPGLPCFTSN